MVENSPAVFQENVVEVYGDLLWNGVLVYIDDIIMCGKSVQGYIAVHVDLLKRMTRAGYELNLKKCKFF